MGKSLSALAQKLNGRVIPDEGANTCAYEQRSLVSKNWVILLRG
jgi:hypothetical protein